MNKQELIQILTNEFSRNGYSGTSMQQITKVCGLAKSSLYYYFPKGKEQMAIEILQDANNWIENDLLKFVRENNISIEDKEKILLDKILAFYENGKKNCLIDIMGLESHVLEIQSEVKKIVYNFCLVFEEILLQKGLRQDEAKKVSLNKLAIIQGSLILARALQDSSYFVRTIHSINF